MTSADGAPRPARWVLLRALEVVVCGLLPLVALYYAIAPVALGERAATDFNRAFYPAAEAVLAGEGLYSKGEIMAGGDELIVEYVYPPLVAIAATPLTVLSVDVAEVVFQIVLVLALVATLAVVGVRDWRCYGLAFLWPPVTDAVTTGNVTLLLGLAAALSWRFRDRPPVAGTSLGISIASKVLLWPLVVWLAAGRRLVAAAWSIGVCVAALLVSWAVIGFRGIADYPDLVRHVSDAQDEEAFTVYALGIDLGLAPGVARALWIALAAALLAATVLAARRGEDRRAFVLAVAASIAFLPVVWLHYFALLLVVVAVVEPRLGPLWFVGLPLQIVVTTGVHNGSTFQTAAVLVLAALDRRVRRASCRGGRGARAGQLVGRSRIVISSSR